MCTLCKVANSLHGLVVIPVNLHHPMLTWNRQRGRRDTSRQECSCAAAIIISDLGCESAESWQLPFTSTIAIIIIITDIRSCQLVVVRPQSGARNVDARNKCFQLCCIIQLMHSSECDIEVWWTRGWKCRTRTQPECDIFSRGLSLWPAWRWTGWLLGFSLWGIVINNTIFLQKVRIKNHSAWNIENIQENTKYKS